LQRSLVQDNFKNIRVVEEIYPAIIRGQDSKPSRRGCQVTRVNFHLFDGLRGAVVSNIFDNYFKVESFFFGLGEVFFRGVAGGPGSDEKPARLFQLEFQQLTHAFHFRRVAERPFGVHVPR